MLRRLRASDRAQSEEIERESFPTLFPPTSFRRELDNHRASYQVAFVPFAEGEATESPQGEAPGAGRGVAEEREGAMAQ